ncbi:signal peptidase II [Planctomycetota bacterium]
MLFLTIASVGCLTDLLTKHWMFDWLGMPGNGGAYWVIENYVGFETALNDGALFGQFAGRVQYLAIFSIAALIGIICWFVFARIGHDLPMTWTLGMITGGILGNLYDRLGLWSQVGQQAVRDWILFQYSSEWKWPNFNIADALLVCGAGMLLVLSWRKPTEQ